MSFSIAGKTAIVTGAASGIGLAIARRFVSEGANVMCADSDEKRLMAELGDKADEDGAIRYFTCDPCAKLAHANLLSATIDAFDRIDILVNGARTVLPSKPLDPKEDMVEELISRNLMSSLRLSQVVAKRMIKQAESNGAGASAGVIINLSTIAARRAHPDLLGYSIASAAVDQMTRSLAVALAPHHIRVNAVAFGSVMSTNLQETLREDTEMREEIIHHTPMARIAPPSELADAVQFLASGGAGFMTGQVLTVDGGRTLVDTVSTPAH